VWLASEWYGRRQDVSLSSIDLSIEGCSQMPSQQWAMPDPPHSVHGWLQSKSGPSTGCTPARSQPVP
jgi:hypothetical protein